MSEKRSDRPEDRRGPTLEKDQAPTEGMVEVCLSLAGDLLVVDAAPEHASLDCCGPSIEPVCRLGHS
jgi:hypothetical protein